MKRLVASLLLATTALGAAAGVRTLWCPTMEVALDHCCCPERESPSEAATLQRAPCCETRQLASTPPGITEQRGQAPVERAALAIATVTAPDLARVVQLEAAMPEPAARARVGPDVPRYTLHRSFLI